MEELVTLLEKTEDVKLHKPAFLSMWDNRIFVISCAFAVLLDPLFSYIFLINDDKKCVMVDRKLKLAYVTLRSATDISYALDIIFCLWRIRNAKILEAWGMMSTVSLNGKRSVSPLLLVHIFVALPLPQVTLLTARGVDSVLLLFTLIQYTVRVYRIYGSLGQQPNIATVKGSWLKATLDFFPFILAAHLFGAAWYYLAVDRIVTCWMDAIGKYDPYCDDLKSSNTVENTKSLINKSCSKSSSNTIVDFGIYNSAIQSGLTKSTKLSLKLLQGFWWGLRNLSSFGSNLDTSLPASEIIFSIFLSISGIVLFLIYFNGRLKVLKKRSKHRKLRQKMQMMNPEIDLWLSKNALPKNLKTVIVKNVQQKLAKNNVVNTDNFLCNLPIKDRRDIVSHLGLTSLKKVSMFKSMDARILKAICEHLKLVTYNEDSYIIRDGEPLEKMFFVTSGTAWSYTTSTNANVAGSTNNGSSIIKCLARGDFYGEELLNWATTKFASFSEFPISTRTLKTQTKVEGFVLRANDLKSVVAKFWWYFSSKNLHQLNNSQLEQWQNLAASSLQAKWRLRHERLIKTERK
ncbi:putative potassium channel, voltage-dependent, EAG/ELK/ERG [Rosa chinensis]|uniref:Putative potassium channel, voltage-dependent, EAG/ELK/ERG n=1 Tax=Rosa chinensis TaxID=74649 RepID=A0A2P6RKB1_ROSCH|nr:putative potassium channel, voltage-dependent, EAG/ELK/ERG [Rosa chinensis]